MGSEMCIRDSEHPRRPHGIALSERTVVVGSGSRERNSGGLARAVVPLRTSPCISDASGLALVDMPATRLRDPGWLAAGTLARRPPESLDESRDGLRARREDDRHCLPPAPPSGEQGDEHTERDEHRGVDERVLEPEVDEGHECRRFRDQTVAFVISPL